MRTIKNQKLALQEKQKHATTPATHTYGGYVAGTTTPPAQTTIVQNASAPASAQPVSYGQTSEQVANAPVPNSGVNAGTSTTATSQSDPLKDLRDEQTQFYDDQAAKTLAALEEKRQLAYASAERQRASAEQNAAVARQRALVDARSAYEQNMSSYGSRAESLASAGLRGSGYNDYLDAQAYATHRSEVQSANAQADAAVRSALDAETHAKQTADFEYTDGALLAQQTADKGKFDANMSYNQALIDQAKASAELHAERGNNVEMIQSLVKSGTLTVEDGQKQTFEHFKTAMDGDDFNVSDVDSAFEKGYVTPDQYDALQAQWHDGNDITDDFFADANGTRFTKKEADEILKNFNNNPWSSPDEKKALQAVYDKLYTRAKIIQGILRYNGEDLETNIDADIGELEEKGNNFSIFHLGITYKVESGGEVTDKGVLGSFSDIEDDTVFIFEDNIYVKKQGRVFKVSNRFFGSDAVGALKKVAQGG